MAVHNGYNNQFKQRFTKACSCLVLKMLRKRCSLQRTVPCWRANTKDYHEVWYSHKQINNQFVILNLSMF